MGALLFGLATSSWEFVLYHSSSTFVTFAICFAISFYDPKVLGLNFVQLRHPLKLGNSQGHHNLEACKSWSLGLPSNDTETACPEKIQGKHLEIGSKEVIEYLVAEDESSGPEDPEV